MFVKREKKFNFILLNSAYLIFCFDVSSVNIYPFHSQDMNMNSA